MILLLALTLLLGIYIGGVIVTLAVVDGDAAPIAALCWPVMIWKG